MTDSRQKQKHENISTIYQRNLQTLAIQIFKVKNNLALEIRNDVSKLKDRSYNTANNSDFRRRNIKTVL